MTQLDEQFDLFSNDPLKGYDDESKKSFWDYHAQNPMIYEKLKIYAKQLKDTGRRQFGIRAIFERIRWDMYLEYNKSDFKINNTYSPFYARLLIFDFPEFEGFFETREVKGITRPNFKKKG